MTISLVSGHAVDRTSKRGTIRMRDRCGTGHEWGILCLHGISFTCHFVEYHSKYTGPFALSEVVRYGFARHARPNDA